MFDINTLRNFTTQLEECQGSRLNKFILKNWDTILTKKQKQFIVDSLNGKEKKYSRQQRSQFRQLIQKRLKDAFLKGGGNVSVHKLVEYHYCVRFIEAFFERARDKQELEGLIRREINKPFLNRIVYEVLDQQSRQNVVDFIVGKNEGLEFKTLYALNNELIKVYTSLDFLECDIEKLIDMNMYK